MCLIVMTVVTMQNKTGLKTGTFFSVKCLLLFIQTDGLVKMIFSCNQHSPMLLIVKLELNLGYFFTEMTKHWFRKFKYDRDVLLSIRSHCTAVCSSNVH